MDKKRGGKWFWQKYPKMVLIILTYAIAFAVFTNKSILPFDEGFSELGLLGFFFLGMLYSFSLTSGPASAFLLILGLQINPVLAAIVAGLGSLFADVILFTLIRYSLTD